MNGVVVGVGFTDYAQKLAEFFARHSAPAGDPYCIARFLGEISDHRRYFRGLLKRVNDAEKMRERFEEERKVEMEKGSAEGFIEQSIKGGNV